LKSFILDFILACNLLCYPIFVDPPIDFPNTSVKSALETVFLKTGVKYSIEVDDINKYGNVTLMITERQELDTILYLILEPHRLKYEKDASGVYCIKKKVDIFRGDFHKLYAFTYARVEKVAAEIRKILTKDGVVSVDTVTNAIIIADFSEVFEGVEDLLSQLDKPGKETNIRFGYMFIDGALPNRKNNSICFSEIEGMIKNKKIQNSYVFDIFSEKNVVSESAFNLKNSKINIKCSAFGDLYMDSKIKIEASFQGEDFCPAIKKINTEFTVKNGEVVPVLQMTLDGKSYGLYLSAIMKDNAPPRCQNTPWISQYEIRMSEKTDVLIDWKQDLPFGANGISHYRAYRDTKPITDIHDMKPIQNFIDGGSTSWMDTTPKERRRTYYYVVTAVNASGMEQAIDSTGRSNVVITIPER